MKKTEEDKIYARSTKTVRCIKANEETIVKSLEGDWRSEHLFVLRLAWENGEQVQEQIQKCDQELMEYTRQWQASAVSLRLI
jgi:hypothetical protein